MLNQEIHGLVLDMDGVLWRDTLPLGNLPDLFNKMQALRLKVTLATNNSTRDVQQYLGKLQDYGVSLEPWQVINSSQATASFLRRQFPAGGPIYIVGEPALRLTLHNAGFEFAEDSVLAVVVGMDRAINYEKLSKACALIRAGAPFIGTNPDLTFPSAQGLTIGTGAILASVEAASGMRPIICGKPSPEMYRIAMDRMGTTPLQTLVVGDRPETDIQGAQALGCRSALVLTGVVNLEQAQEWRPPPDWIAADLTTLINQIADNR